MTSSPLEYMWVRNCSCPRLSCRAHKPRPFRNGSLQLRRLGRHVASFRSRVLPPGLTFSDGRYSSAFGGVNGWDEKLGISRAAGPTYSCLGRKCPRLLSLAFGAVEMAPITVYSLLQAAVATSRQWGLFLSFHCFGSGFALSSIVGFFRFWPGERQWVGVKRVTQPDPAMLGQFATGFDGFGLGLLVLVCLCVRILLRLWLRDILKKSRFLHQGPPIEKSKPLKIKCLQV